MPRPRIQAKTEVTDEQIMAFDNVPVPIAASYIGWSPNKLYYALQDGRAPFGFVCEVESSKRVCGASWTYNISPGLLVAYKRGTMAIISRDDIMTMVKDAAYEAAVEFEKRRGLCG